MVFRRCSIAGVEYCQEIPYELHQEELSVDNVVVSTELVDKFRVEYCENQVCFFYF